MDEIDDALSEYEPTDTESDVQDASVMMDQPAAIAEGPVDETPITSGELDRIAAQPGNAPVVSSRPVQPSGEPLIAARQALAMGNETANAQGGVGDAIKIQNEAKAQQLEDEHVQTQIDEQERRDKEAEHNAILERTHSEVEAAQKKYSEFKFHDHWRDASPANKALAIIFSAVGGAAATRAGGQNEALRAMDDITEREYKRDMAELSKQENFIKWKRDGEKDLVGRFEKERANLLVQQSERLKHMANYAQSQYLRKNPGATVEEAKNSELAAGLRQKASETYSNAVRDIYKIQTSLAAAKERAKQNGGSTAALQLFITQAGALKPGEPITPALAVLGKQAGLKPNQIAGEADKYRNSGAKSDKLTGSPQIGDVHGPGGEVIGNISTGDPALDRKRAEEVAKANAIYTDLTSTLKKLDESRKTEGKHLPSIGGIALSDVAAKREALHSHALIQLKEMAKLGVLAGPDMAIMEAQLGGGMANSSGFGESKLGEITKIVNNGHARFLDSVGMNGNDAIKKLRDEGKSAKQSPGTSVVETRRTASGKVLEKLSDGTIRERK